MHMQIFCLVHKQTAAGFKKKKKDCRCMVLEFGSCAEYHSHDIADYLKTVNNVPEGYDCRVGGGVANLWI